MKKIIAILLTASMALLSACGQTPGAAESTSSSSEAENTAAAATSNGKGRYVEQEISLPGELEWHGPMISHPDGSISILNMSTSEFVTSDETVSSFTVEKPAFLEQLGEISYIASIACSKDGEYVLEYSLPEEEDVQSYKPLYAYVSADGTVTPLTIDLGNYFVKNFYFTKDNRIIATDIGGNVYEVDKETGKTKALFSGIVSFCGFAVTTNYIVAIDSDNIYFYNLNTGELSQNPEALTSFLSQQNILREDVNSESFPYNFCEGEEDIFYILNTNGLYRYVLNGSSVEQLIDGKLCSLSNPAYYVKSFLQETSGSFLILYGGGKLIRYTYDSEVSSVPDTLLKIYSFRDNTTIRQAISQYQLLYPDMFVDYEVAMSEDGNITYSDALKNLNTEILAGTGPDVIVMDDLPIENYINKGLLVDLSDYTAEINPDDSLLTNISNCYEADGKLYAMTGKFRLPVVVAHEDTLNKIQDLPSVLNAVTAFREASPDQDVLDTRYPVELLQNTLLSCGNELSSSKGIDEKKLTELLQITKKLYDLDTSAEDLATQDEQEHRGISFYKEMGYDMNTMEALWAFSSGEGLDLLSNNTEISLGVLSGFGYDFNITASLNKVDDTIDYRFGLSKDSKLFIPSCVLGISASSTNTDAAVKFIQTAFSSQVQEVEMQDGFPVNKTALQTIYDNSKDPDKEAGSMASSNSDGSDYFSFEIHWPTQEQINDFDQTIQSLDTYYVQDKMTSDIIMESGIKYIKGNTSLEDTVKEIMDKVKLRLAE